MLTALISGRGLYLRKRHRVCSKQARREAQGRNAVAFWQRDVYFLVSMTIVENLQAKRAEILRVASAHGAAAVRVFGSVARGEAGPHSDVDLLVRMEPGRSLLDHVALWQELEDLLGCKVDVVSEKALHRLIRQQVLDEAVPL